MSASFEVERHYAMPVVLRIAVAVGKYFLLPIGALILAGAIYAFVDTKAWLGRSVEAEGSVVEMVRVVDRDTHSSMFAPLVRFKTADGKSIEFQSSTQSNPPAYYAGQTVTVLYDPGKPNSAAIAGLFSIWGVALILGIIGTVFTGIGLALALVGRRLSRAA